ncbi:unnamed protein product [Caenorhabditis bovis]|uniref:Uncharacterized protein n=1 Tax=Caenorhabditis bovis TaxID=2654633 RepID=A0A8S1EMC2_9PELO|nr:unnamed protein product [Caenorhabditis bovis]
MKPNTSDSKLKNKSSSKKEDALESNRKAIIQKFKGVKRNKNVIFPKVNLDAYPLIPDLMKVDNEMIEESLSTVIYHEPIKPVIEISELNQPKRLPKEMRCYRSLIRQYLRPEPFTVPYSVLTQPRIIAGVDVTELTKRFANFDKFLLLHNLSVARREFLQYDRKMFKSFKRVAAKDVDMNNPDLFGYYKLFPFFNNEPQKVRFRKMYDFIEGICSLRYNFDYQKEPEYSERDEYRKIYLECAIKMKNMGNIAAFDDLFHMPKKSQPVGRRQDPMMKYLSKSMENVSSLDIPCEKNPRAESLPRQKSPIRSQSIAATAVTNSKPRKTRRKPSQVKQGSYDPRAAAVPPLIGLNSIPTTSKVYRIPKKSKTVDENNKTLENSFNRNAVLPKQRKDSEEANTHVAVTNRPLANNISNTCPSTNAPSTSTQNSTDCIRQCPSTSRTVDQMLNHQETNESPATSNMRSKPTVDAMLAQQRSRKVVDMMTTTTKKKPLNLKDGSRPILERADLHLPGSRLNNERREPGYVHEDALLNDYARRSTSIGIGYDSRSYGRYNRQCPVLNYLPFHAW